MSSENLVNVCVNDDDPILIKLQNLQKYDELELDWVEVVKKIHLNVVYFSQMMGQDLPREKRFNIRRLNWQDKLI
ncbi:14462_t:CDS:2 [Ambispora leptoticha]|uniref:14462_t:CDS:1 n=1 Tax=Ambispora leptoticha TaxID=144679 RepID=A0A9N9AXW6_9GLOM|nr:14462_t:CDS:2 [Ambispora leptoticha]